MGILGLPLISDRIVPVALYLQGGAALGAFSAGALIALTENSNIRIVGISGTSINAVQGAFATEAMIKGGRGAVPARLHELWRNLTECQYKGLPLWLHATQSMYDYAELGLGMVHGWSQLASLPARAVGFPQIPNILDRTGLIRTTFHHAQDHMLSAGITTLPSSPILDFLDHMRTKGIGLDFDALQQTNNLVINATRVLPTDDPWTRHHSDGVGFRGADITPETLAASGALPQLMKAVTINDVPYYDGGLSANPLLCHPDEFGAGQDVVCILVRSRPEESLGSIGAIVPATASEKSAFFNQITDRQWADFVPPYPGRTLVIQPDRLETGRHMVFAPEFDFRDSSIQPRIQAGYAAAQQQLELLLQDPTISLMAHMSSTVGRLAMRA